jgi:5-hydroxyisourate hydrolase
MITTQVIDNSSGRPAPGVPVELDYFITGHGWKQVGQGVTNTAGLIESFGESEAAGIYRLSFDIAAYHSELRALPEAEVEAFFPSISITFELREAGSHCHLPLFLSPYGYSTYRA